MRILDGDVVQRSLYVPKEEVSSSRIITRVGYVEKTSEVIVVPQLGGTEG